MKPFIVYILCFLIITVFSCQKADNDKALVENLYNSYIRIPTDSLGKISIGNIEEREHKDNEHFNIIVYHDSTMCSACEVQRLYEWESFISGLKKEEGIELGITIIFSPSKGEYAKLINAIKNVKPSIPIYIDTTGCFIRNNTSIPPNSLLHTFVINKQGKVVLIGNMMNNKRLTNLFLKNIATKAQTKN